VKSRVVGFPCEIPVLVSLQFVTIYQPERRNAVSAVVDDIVDNLTQPKPIFGSVKSICRADA
jgi:hypothetical protein